MVPVAASCFLIVVIGVLCCPVVCSFASGTVAGSEILEHPPLNVCTVRSGSLLHRLSFVAGLSKAPYLSKLAVAGVLGRRHSARSLQGSRTLASTRAWVLA